MVSSISADGVAKKDQAWRSSLSAGDYPWLWLFRGISPKKCRNRCRIASLCERFSSATTFRSDSKWGFLLGEIKLRSWQVTINFQAECW
ncbi:hypothetical protein RHSIM_Rhsim02G0047300 [Rhododendron simsii]|uniref:Uncharacterized protein n=1 Tax=Rhododendron simsii TaxID=118357 RepID=A0A834HDD5_RHOSS|nr:hypothetical protein RHSIM_Rhsim02G0047300 [Rhododendron simsii]